MTGVKKESHQRKLRHRRIVPNSNKNKIAPDDLGMVVDIDEYTIPFDSVSSVSDSARASTCTSNDNAGRSPPSTNSSLLLSSPGSLSSRSSGITNHDDGSTVITHPTITSTNITNGPSSITNAYIAPSHQSTGVSSHTSDTSINPMSNTSTSSTSNTSMSTTLASTKVSRETNIVRQHKRRKKTRYFTLTDSSYNVTLRNKMIDDKKASKISLSSIRRTALNHFEPISYKNHLALDNIGSTRRSLRFLGVATSPPVSPIDPICYDLNSRKLRRYIIEDVMFVSPGESIVVLICNDSTDFSYWDKIIKEQDNGLDVVCFGSKTFYQINATVIKNVSRHAFINGEYDNDLIDYHVLGIGGAAISLSFVKCARSTGIELKFSQILLDVNVQIWGVTPMRRNMIRCLQRRGKGSRMGLLKCMLDELWGDHAQTLQISTVAQEILKEDETTTGGTPILDVGAVLNQVCKDKDLSVQFVQKALSSPVSESALLQLNKIVNKTIMASISQMYGYFVSLNTPILSNNEVSKLIVKYKELMPVHHASILSMLNVETKIRDKRYQYLQGQYDRTSLWIFLSLMRARNNHLFTWWAMISTAARYGAKSDASASFNEAVFFGSCTSHNTLIRNTAVYRDDKKTLNFKYTHKCRDSIEKSHTDFIMIAMDNNQRGQRRKQQRQGTSNMFVVVTHSLAIQPLPMLPMRSLTGMVYNHKSPVTYLHQSIVSVNGMSGCETITTIEQMVQFITNDSSIPTPTNPDFSGRRVNRYYDILRLCYGLLQQRQFLSRSETEFNFIDHSAQSQAKPVISLLNSNRSNDGLYANARRAQQREVEKWFGIKDKVKICFLPTSKEDETTNLGCAVVFLEILENAGLIKITRGKTVINGEEKTKLVVRTVFESQHKWLYLTGDGLTHVRLKSFITAINNSLYSYQDDYEMRMVLSRALKQVVLGVGDLHGGGFAILNTIYTLFYGGFLQVFQTAMGWKRIKGSDIVKTYQQAKSLVEIVYTEVMRGLHYMHVASFVSTCNNEIVGMDPSKLAVEMVVDFDVFLDNKIRTSSDKVLCVIINFVKLVSQYKMFKEAVTVGDSITVEKLYNDYLPVFIQLRKHNYYNIILDQTEEYYGRIPYRVLQWIRHNRFQKLYNGVDRKNISLSHWALDALMELMNKNVKELDFPNTIEGWQLHSQNIMLALASRAFVTNAYSSHRNVDIQDAKNKGEDEYIDMSQKGNVKTKTTPTNRTTEKLMCAEILFLSKSFTEVPNRKFDNKTYWGVLGSITTKFNKPSQQSTNSKECDTLSSLTTSIFDKSNTTSEEYTVDYSLLDADVVIALADVEVIDVENDGDEEECNDVSSSSLAEITLDNGIGPSLKKVNKVSIHESAALDVILHGSNKMIAMNLTAVRHRKNVRLAREQVAIRDTIYNNVINITKNNICEVAIKELKESEDSNLFGTWDREINSLV